MYGCFVGEQTLDMWNVEAHHSGFIGEKPLTFRNVKDWPSNEVPTGTVNMLCVY